MTGGNAQMRHLLAHEFDHSWYLAERVVFQIAEEVVVPPARPPMFMRRERLPPEDVRVAAMIGESYLLYTDMAVPYDYMDFVTRWLMAPNIYDALLFPPTRSSRAVGSSHSGGVPSTSVAAATSEVPFMWLHTPSYNIWRADGGMVPMLHRPHAMDPEKLGLTEEVLHPVVDLSILFLFWFLLIFSA